MAREQSLLPTHPLTWLCRTRGHSEQQSLGRRSLQGARGSGNWLWAGRQVPPSQNTSSHSRTNPLNTTRVTAASTAPRHLCLHHLSPGAGAVLTPGDLPAEGPEGANTTKDSKAKANREAGGKQPLHTPEPGGWCWGGEGDTRPHSIALPSGGVRSAAERLMCQSGLEKSLRAPWGGREARAKEEEQDPAMHKIPERLL